LKKKFDDWKLKNKKKRKRRLKVSMTKTGSILEKTTRMRTLRWKRITIKKRNSIKKAKVMKRKSMSK